MTAFAENQWFEVERCCNCGMAFALTSDFQRARRKDHGYFYCPSGHAQHYTGPTEAEKLKAELDRKAELLAAAQARASTAEQNLSQVTRAHKKMRERVVNGVCPCCNRSFANLREHMKTEHADFAAVRTMYSLRQAFAMTQAAVAREAGVDTTYVSLYERARPLPGYAKLALDAWLERHAALDTSNADKAKEQT